jgi:Mo-co oxidoreductase dimerisation domain
LTPEQMKPVTSLQVKSVIASPLDNTVVKVGVPLMIRGVAWSGDSGPVVAVDVSTDTGRSWKPASLVRGQETQFGWRQWEYAWTPERDSYYTIMARARDAGGNTQPFEQEWNPSGYGWNVVPRVRVDTVSREGLPRDPAPVQPAFTARGGNTCLTCHGEDVIRQQHLTRAQWDREITKMTNWGAEVKPEDRNALLDYLFANFGQRP